MANGVRHVFTVPGESVLPVLDALRDSGIAVTTCRQEGAAATMAKAHGKATGAPIPHLRRHIAPTSASMGYGVPGITIQSG